MEEIGNHLRLEPKTSQRAPLGYSHFRATDAHTPAASQLIALRPFCSTACRQTVQMATLVFVRSEFRCNLSAVQLQVWEHCCKAPKLFSVIRFFFIPITNNSQLKAQALQDSLKRQRFVPSALVGSELGCHTLPDDSIWGKGQSVWGKNCCKSKSLPYSLPSMCRNRTPLFWPQPLAGSLPPDSLLLPWKESLATAPVPPSQPFSSPAV